MYFALADSHKRRKCEVFLGPIGPTIRRSGPQSGYPCDVLWSRSRNYPVSVDHSASESHAVVTTMAVALACAA